ncbi:hypothetical protein IWQ57_006375, partial [Coemansia nantahalensis]
MTRWLARAAAVAAVAGGVAGNQLWHDVNRYDAHGHECRLRDKQTSCSPLCVDSLSSCPEALQPSCPDGQSFCADGACHDECTPDIQAQNL